MPEMENVSGFDSDGLNAAKAPKENAEWIIIIHYNSPLTIQWSISEKLNTIPLCTLMKGMVSACNHFPFTAKLSCLSVCLSVGVSEELRHSMPNLAPRTSLRSLEAVRNSRSMEANLHSSGSRMSHLPQSPTGRYSIPCCLTLIHKPYCGIGGWFVIPFLHSFKHPLNQVEAIIFHLFSVYWKCFWRVLVIHIILNS